MNWTNTSMLLPPDEEIVLLVIEKNNRTTRGENGTFVVEGFLRRGEDEFRWYDYTGRLLCIMNGKTTTNKVTHWTTDYTKP